MSFRTYFDVAGTDGSRLAEQIDRHRARVAERLAGVERVVVVLSGKGGVGKSYVTAALAVALARRGLAVGVVDADLHGPTIARLLGARGPLVVTEDGVLPAVGHADVRVISSDLLLEEGRALRWSSTAGEEHVWRGAAEAGVLREFFGDVRWGTLTALLVDMPPDAARLRDLAALVPRIAAAVAVTIPSEESERSVARALDAAREARVPIAAIVENMSGYACARCGALAPLFRGDAGTRLAAVQGVPLLVRLPFSAAPPRAAASTLSQVADAVLEAR